MRDILDAPIAIRREVEQHLFDWFPLYEKNHLLVAGGAAEQPAKYLDYMREITSLNSVMSAKLTREDREYTTEE